MERRKVLVRRMEQGHRLLRRLPQLVRLVLPRGHGRNRRRDDEKGARPPALRQLRHIRLGGAHEHKRRQPRADRLLDRIVAQNIAARTGRSYGEDIRRRLGILALHASRAQKGDAHIRGRKRENLRKNGPRQGLRHDRRRVVHRLR